MRNKMKKLMLIIIVAIGIIFIQNKVEAKSYHIEDMDIQASINQDGSVAVEQTLTYKFNGQYNGIYITVPYNKTDSQYADIIKNNKINNNLYTGSGITVESVSKIVGNGEIPYNNSSYGRNGQDGIYTIEHTPQVYKVKVYSPSNSETKTFKINYTIKNLCVSHNDTAELYYNFIGGDWECAINKLNIDVYIPANKSEIKVWGHGPYNGKSEIISNTHANFKVNNVQAGEYVAARVLFDNSNIPNSTKKSGIEATAIVRENENDIIEHKEEKQAFTRNVIIMGVCLLIYWIILLLVYEKDKKYMVENIDEDYLFEKYNAIMAGCIQGSRNILARDIIAEILNLIDKGNIKLEIKNKLTGGKYLYEIEKVPEKEHEMDSIQKYVYDWVFDTKQTEELADRLKEMPKFTEANKKFKELNRLVEDNMARLGANKQSVPKVLRVFNMFLFIIAVIVVIKHIGYNGLNMFETQAPIFMTLVCIWPLAIGLISIFLNVIIMIRHSLNKAVQRVSGQKIVTTTISLLVLFGIIMLITAILTKGSYLVADEFLICIATILILTDNLMLKNNANLIGDYSKLNTLKYKLENTLLDERDVEHLSLIHISEPTRRP